MMAMGQPGWLLLLTLFSYWAGCKLHRRIPHVLMSPVFTGTLLVIAALAFTHTDYHTYKAANEPLIFLLGPAQVAMAVPLFRGWALLKKHFAFVLAGVCIGGLSGILTAILLGKFLHLSRETLLALAPKSATTPVAMAVSQVVGGAPELAAVFAVMTGILGIAGGPALLRWIGVRNRLWKGLVLGTAGQMMGAARAAEWGDAAAAMGIAGMVLTALLIGVFFPFLAPFLF